VVLLKSFNERGASSLFLLKWGILKIGETEPRSTHVPCVQVQGRAQRKGFSFAFFAALAVRKSAESDRVRHKTFSCAAFKPNKRQLIATEQSV